MPEPLRFLVSDLLAEPGRSRVEEQTTPIVLELPGASVHDDAEVALSLTSLTGGVMARGSARVEVRLACNRCLAEWSETLEVPIDQVFRLQPDEDQDELPIEQGQWVDLGPVVHDEVSLALPAAPLCRPDCKGLCPTCGTDLNTGTCDCPGDEPRSPFAALKQLFDS